MAGVVSQDRDCQQVPGALDPRQQNVACGVKHAEAEIKLFVNVEAADLVTDRWPFSLCEHESPRHH